MPWRSSFRISKRDCFQFRLRRSFVLCFVVAVLLATIVSRPLPGSAKAHLIIVFPLRSTPALSSVATKVTSDIVNRLAAIPGFDAQLLPAPATGGLGGAAATAGADLYVVGAISDNGSNDVIDISSFDASNDVVRATVKETMSASGTLPTDFDVNALIQAAAPSPAPVANNLVSGLALGTPIGIRLDDPLSSRGATDVAPSSATVISGGQ